jgi:tetratricopeptide (TPR) repeat protein
MMLGAERGQVMKYAAIFLAFISALQASGATAGAPMSQAPEVAACMREDRAPAICLPRDTILVAADEERPKSIHGMTPFDDAAPCPIEPPFFLPLERAEAVLPGCRAFVASQPAGSSALATALAKQGLLVLSLEVFRDSGKKTGEGQAAIERALTIDPDNLTALLSKVTALEWLGKVVEARPTVERLSALYPDEPRVRRAYAELMGRVGSSEEELAALDRTLEIAPDDMDTHRQRADLLARLGRDDEAITELDLMIDTQPNDGYALYKRAELELARGDAAAALADAENARINGFASSETIFLLIQANLAVGNLEKALAEVAAIQGQNYPQDKDPVLTFYRFAILNRLGRKEEAEDALVGLSRERPEHILRIQVFLRNMGFEAVQISGAFDEITKQQLAACLLKGACSSTFQRVL